MRSLYKISSHLRYGVARARKLEPRVFISSINMQWICRHAAAGSRLLTLHPLILSTLALVVLWYLYGMIFGISQSSHQLQSTQKYSLLLRALKSSSPKPPRRTTVTTTLLSTQRKFEPVTNRTLQEKDVTKLPVCDMPPDLGPIAAYTEDIVLAKVEKKYPEVQWGGWYSPPNCTARHKVAVIVPYRDRKINLAVFLNHMHPFLMKQRIEYGIYIVEQQGIKEFNRGKLMNVGFVESLRHREWHCFIFHDIDILPLDQRNLYYCPPPLYPRFLDISAVRANEHNRTMKSYGIFGGVSALTRDQFIRANGYSNGYWGWGGEDDDLYHRLADLDYGIIQYNMSIARYTTLQHRQISPNPGRYRILLQTLKGFHRDGLNKLRYLLVSITLHSLYTHVVVNVDQSYHDIQELLQEQSHFRKLIQKKVA